MPSSWFNDPMKATSGRLPAGPEWTFELKWDGMRRQAGIHQGRVELRSASGRNVTTHFPELHSLGHDLGLDVALDGQDITLLPYRDRRRLLSEAIPDGPS